MDKIYEAWMEIHGSAPNIPGVEDFMNYIVNTLINDEGSKYERILWNQYDNSNIGSVRANNPLESFHSSFARSFKSPHPNVFALVTQLKKKQKTGTKRRHK